MGLSTCAKGCIACGVCTVVVLAIMIPVGILVIAPKMGQHALDVSEMNIPNATVYDIPDNLHANHMAQIFNSVSLKQSSLPLAAKLHETQMVMHVPPGGSPGFGWPETNLAWFTMPEQDIKHGTNEFQVNTDLTVFENTDYFVHWAFNMLFGGLATGTVVHTPVYIVGQPKLTALGFISMDLKLGKKLNCTYIPAPTTTPAPPPSTSAPTTTPAPPPSISSTVSPSTSPSTLKTTVAPTTTASGELEQESITARLLAGVGSLGPVTMSCTDDGELDDDLLDAVLANFTQDLARTTTTTTTTTKAATTTAVV